MKVPFIDLKRTTPLVKSQVLGQWERAIDNTEFVGGPTVAALEARLAELLSAKHAVSCSSGTDAILIGLQALGIGPGSKVALPNLTFWATYEAVAQLGATPVLLDVDEDLQMDLAELELACKTLKLDAAILVHLMGWATPRLAEVRRFCDQKGIALLEDGAQSFGVEVGGRSVYEGARISTLSFYPAKVIGGCMDGGAILTNDPALAELVRKLCNHGRATHYSYSHVGWNSRMGGVQAAWLLELLKHTDAILKNRRAMHDRSFELLEKHGSCIRRHGPPQGVLGNGYLTVCETLKHDAAVVAKRLSEAGVSTSKVYPETLDVQAPAAGAIRISELSRGREFCKRVINLPLFYGMTEEEVSYVHEALARVLAKET
jgi:UDP-2-acetamido-2-deoxy-ribo-hexuluronate aminotransferase